MYQMYQKEGKIRKAEEKRKFSGMQSVFGENRKNFFDKKMGKAGIRAYPGSCTHCIMGFLTRENYIV